MPMEARVLRTEVLLTLMNFLGFLMIGPFTPYTLYIGIPAGFIAVIYSILEILTLVSNQTRLFAGILLIANIFILYVSIDFLA